MYRRSDRTQSGAPAPIPDKTDQTGILELNLREQKAQTTKTAQPEIDLTVAAFKISGASDNGDNFALTTDNAQIKENGPEATIIGLSVGRWTITISDEIKYLREISKKYKDFAQIFDKIARNVIIIPSFRENI